MATTTPNFGLRKPANSDLVNVTTDISDNMDLLDAHAHSGTYGRVFPVAAYATIHDAYAALVAAGGGTLEVRGTFPVATDFLVDEAVPCVIDGYGGTLEPAAGVVALSFEVGSSSVPVVAVSGLTVDGTAGGGSAGGTTGVRIKSQFGAVLRDVQINHCGKGVVITDTASNWSEGSDLDAVEIRDCLIGVDVVSGGGTGSFGYFHWGRVSIFEVPTSGVGFRVGSSCFLYHTDISMLVIQTGAALTGGTTATCMDIAGAVGRNNVWHVMFESSGGAFSGTRNGLTIQSGSVLDGLALRLYWQGTFTNKIVNSSGIEYQLRETNDRDLKSGTNTQNLQSFWVFGDANPRMIARAGRILFGDGTSTVDAAIVRYGGDRVGVDTGDSWQIDGTYNGGTLRLGTNRVWVDSSDNLRIKNGTPSSDTDGTAFASLVGPFAPSITGAVSATRYVGGTASVAPTTGTFEVGDFVITQGGSIYICTSAGSPGTWVLAQANHYAPYAGTSPLPTGVLAESFPRVNPVNNLTAILTSGRIALVGINLPSGLTVTSITFASRTTALATGSNQWFGLFDSSRNKLAVTSDDTSTAWGSNTLKTLNLSAPWVTTYQGLYYLGVVVVASTVPTMCGISASTALLTGRAPSLAVTADSGLTNPASCPATLAAFTNATEVLYASVA